MTPTMPTTEELREIFEKCLTRHEDGRYYPTQAGCTRLQEMLAEKGLNARVTISEDRRFSVEFQEDFL